MTSVFPLLVQYTFLFLLSLFVTKHYLYYFPLTITDCSSILASVIYRRKGSLESDEEEKKIKNSIYDNQRVDWNSENHEGERLTSPMEKNKNIIYQGIKTQRPKLMKK